MSAATQRLFTGGAVRAIEQYVLADKNQNPDTLMLRAGHAAWRQLRWCWPRARRIGVVCGSGNNGGDGYVLARLAHEQGFQVALFAVGDATSAPALAAAQAARRAGCNAQSLSASTKFSDCDVVVDALLGIGLRAAPRAPVSDAIAHINQAARPVLALDVPSGVDADTGAVPGVAVQADVTVTFIALKLGLFTGNARGFAGEVYLEDLQIAPTALAVATPAARRIVREDFVAHIPPRRVSAHKGDHGHVALLAGNRAMAGAAVLAAGAAYRVGAGLVTLATHSAHAAYLSATIPEPIVVAADDVDVAALCARADIVACGPGIGRDRWAESLYDAALASERPVVLDADGLNLLARQTSATKRDDWILTPHPGEAARLLKCDVADIQRDRVAAARAIVQNFGGVCVLKGSGTVVTDADGVWICDRGNAALATAGSGDVLTGTIAGLLAQGVPALAAAQAGVWLHALAGERCSRAGMRGAMAHDLLPHIRALLQAAMEGHALE